MKAARSDCEVIALRTSPRELRPVRSSLVWDASRIDSKTGALGREAVFRLREPEFVPHEVHQIGRVLAVMNGESRIESDLACIVPQEPGADPMEGPGPERIGHDTGAVAHNDIWTVLLEVLPVALLAPWCRGSRLPTKGDCERILGLTPAAYSSSRPVASRIRFRAPAVTRTLREAGITIRDSEPPTGYVRLRRLINDPTEWSIKLSPNAMPLKDFVAGL